MSINKTNSLLFGLITTSLIISAVSIYKVSVTDDSLQKLQSSMNSGDFIRNNKKALISSFNEYEISKKKSQIEDFISSKKLQYPMASNKVPKGKHIYGDINARFTLVVFSDLKCPYCQRYHKNPKTVVENSNGLVNWEFRHFPLNMHNPVAAQLAQATECVSGHTNNQTFWMFLDEVVIKPKLEGIEDLARMVGANPQEFGKCMQSGQYQDVVLKDYKKGEALGVSSTPYTIIVDNKTGNSMGMAGAQSPQAIVSQIQSFKQRIDIELKETAITENKEKETALSGNW